MIKQILNLFIPPVCIFCKEKTKRDLSLCLACENDFPFIKNACFCCAKPLSVNDTNLCGTCLKKTPIINQTIAACFYEPPISKIITDLKFHHHLLSAKILSHIMIQRLQQEKILLPEIIIPVPLHKKRLKDRGFNQSLEIAKPIARHFNIPINLSLCQRIKNTEAQSSLPAKDRKHNVKKAFEIRGHHHFRHAVIIDDVVTTGHTVSELARTLKKSGVEKVDVWCCARTSE